MKQITDRILKSASVNWRRFQFIQDAEFKNISKEQFQKIKDSIVNNGFCESFKVWQDGKTLYCLDGFHRTQALLELEQEGYTVPDLMQADFIDCRNRKEAAKLVLVYSSIYASVSDEGLYKHLHEFELNLDDIKAEIDLPNFNLEYFEDSYFEGEEGEGGGGSGEDNFNIIVECDSFDEQQKVYKQLNDSGYKCKTIGA